MRNRLLDILPVRLGSFGPASDNQSVTSVFRQKNVKSRDEAFQSFVRSDVSKKEQGLIAAIYTRLPFRILGRERSVRDGIIDSKWDNAHFTHWNAKVGYKFISHPFGMN